MPYLRQKFTGTRQYAGRKFFVYLSWRKAQSSVTFLILAISKCSEGRRVPGTGVAQALVHERKPKGGESNEDRNIVYGNPASSRESRDG